MPGRLIADAILGAATAMPTPGAFRTKFADLLQIHLGRPAYIAMWLQGRRVLASHPDHDLEPRRRRHRQKPGLDPSWRGDAIRPPGTNELEIVVRLMPDGAGIEPGGGRVADRILAVFQGLGEHDEDLARFATDLLSQPEEPEALVDPDEDLPALELSDADVREFLAPFRARYEAALESLSIAASPLLSWWKGKTIGHCLNLFSVVRYVPSIPFHRTVTDGDWRHDYPYTARILPAGGLQGALGRLAGSEGVAGLRTAGELLDALEEPLGDGARFIADTPLQSGCVHLADLSERHPAEGHAQRDLPGQDTRARTRHAVESALYASEFPGATQGCFVPIHVGGAPWLCLYSLSDESWGSFLRNYYVYRELVPKIADRARYAAKEAFLDCLVGAFRTHVSSELSDSRLGAINGAWLRASMVYPFPICSLRRLGANESEDAEDVFRLGHHRLRVSMRRGVPALRPQVRYEFLTLRDVVSRLQNESYALRERARQAQEVALEDVLHGTTTAVRAIRIGDLAQSLSRFRQTPIRETGDLRFKLMQLGGTGEHVEAAQALVKGLNHATMAYESALALLQLGELSLHRGPLRAKFQAGSAKALVDLVHEGHALAWAALPATVRDRCTAVDLEITQDAPGTWIIPDHYLDTTIIRGILAEVVKNACEKAVVEADGRVVLGASLLRLATGGVACTFENGTSGIGGTARLRSGFLKRTQLLLENLETVRLFFEPRGSTFTAGLELGPLAVETQGTTTSVAPYLDPLEHGGRA